MKKILITNPFGVGDILFTTPLIKALIENIPGAKIGYLANIRTYEILTRNPYVAKVFIYEKDDYRKLWRKSKPQFFREFLRLLFLLKRERFELAIDLSLNEKFGFFLKLLGIPKRVGFNYRKRGKFLTDQVNITGYHDKHMVEYYLDLVRLLGIVPKETKINFFTVESDELAAEKALKDAGLKENETLLGLVPGGGASWGQNASIKHWPMKNFAEVGKWFIREVGAKIIIFGSHDEKRLCQTLQDSIGSNTILACNQNLPQFAALVKHCKLLITNDGGPLHVAVGVGVKTISIFGPVDEKVYGPYPQGKDHIVLSGKVACRPCYKNFKLPPCEKRECILSIKVEDVILAAQKLLESQNHPLKRDC